MAEERMEAQMEEVSSLEEVPFPEADLAMQAPSLSLQTARPTTVDPFPSDYTGYKASLCVITKAPSKALSRVSVDTDTLPCERLSIGGEHDDRHRMIRVSVPLSHGSESQDEMLRVHAAFTSTQDNFKTTHVALRAVRLTYDDQNRIIDLQPEDPTLRSVDFIIEPPLFPGFTLPTACKIDCTTTQGIRTYSEMCTNLIGGSTHATMEIIHPRGNPNHRIVSVLLENPAYHAKKKAMMEENSPTLTTPYPKAPVPEPFVVDFTSLDNLNVTRVFDGTITNLSPKPGYKPHVKFMSTHPEKLGYLVKYDCSPSGVQTWKEARERIVRETGCTLELGPVVPVPGQIIKDIAELHYLQTVEVARRRSAGTT